MMYRSKKSELSASELLDLLNEQDECDWLEAKSLAHDTSRSVLESVNSFANEPGLGGGVILLGIAENEEEDGPRYVVEGIADTDKAQLDLATQCKSAFNSAVYPTIQVERIGDKSVLKVIVDELPQAHKPLYFKKDGLPKGAYRRIGSADLMATDDDLWKFYEDPDSKFDETPVKGASVDDVDPKAVTKYREMRRKVDPQAVELDYDTPDLLTALGCTNPDNPRQLNMAGVLLFGNERLVARACPLSRVDYIRILGNDWHKMADEFSGTDTYAPIFLMVDKLVSIIYGELTTRHRFNADSMQPETETFPIEVMREALVNMLMHRDYRHGQFTQIIRYDNRIEICNSGCSLKPDEMLGLKGSVARNETLARVCHDTKLAETKGSGIDRMWSKMTEAGLSRPTMESDRVAGTFTIRLLLHHFLDAATLDWLKRFAQYELNDNQRTALVFLREVGALDAFSYRQLTGCLAKAVAPDLAGLKRQGLMVQKGQRRGTYYVPSELLKENIPLRAESIPAGGESIPPAMPDNGENPQARGENPQARGENPQARGENPQVQMPESIRNRIAELKRHERRSVISCLIYDMCNVRPLTKSELAKMLNRTEDYVAELVKPMLGERLEYLYPMMVHHPHQAYVAKSSNNH